MTAFNMRFDSSWPGSSRPSTSCLLLRRKDVDARAKPGHDDGEAVHFNSSAPGTTAESDCTRRLLDLRRNSLEDLDETLAVALTDDVIKVAFVPARATGHHRENFLSGRRQVQAVGAPVAIHAFALDQSAPHEVFDDRRKAGLVAAIGLRQLCLADARIARDERQGRETPRALANILRTARERLKCGFLRHA